jgi:hypothetical protein
VLEVERVWVVVFERRGSEKEQRSGNEMFLCCVLARC